MKKQNQPRTMNLSDLIRTNENAERVVIGSLLTVPNAIMNICDGLTSDMFYDPYYANIYSVVQLLDSESKKIDMLTVSERMKKQGMEVDLSVMVEVCNSYSFDILPHTLMVKEKAIERGVIGLIHESTLKMQENEDVADILFSIGEKASLLQESLVGSEMSEHISLAVTESITELNRRIDNREKGLMPGIPTGLADLNKHTGGWQKQDLIVIAGRPGMGKTSIVLTFAQAAAETDTPVAVFSLEMGRRQLTDKLIVGNSGILSDAFKAGIIQPEQQYALQKSVDMLSSLPIYIDDKPSVSIGYVRSRCRLLHKQGKCEMVIIDYLQLMSGTKDQGGNREQEISSISRGCKAIAKELDIPVILLSQLNRKCEDRSDKRPMLQDLRESGAIEQDADIVVFINRPEKYGMECKDSNDNTLKNGMELIFAKFRNGSTGMLYAQHNDSLTKLYDINTRQYEESTFENRSYSEPKKDEDSLMPF